MIYIGLYTLLPPVSIYYTPPVPPTTPRPSLATHPS